METCRRYVSVNTVVACSKPLNHTPNPFKIAMMVIILLLMAGLIIFSARAGKSYVSQYRINATIDRWQHRAAINRPTLNRWQAMESIAIDALNSDSSNPDLQNALGRLYDYRAALMSDTGQHAIEYSRKAIDHYRTVISLRPVWPYGYLNLLYSKARTRVFDREFRHHLLRLIALAPWEKSTLPDIVQLASDAWLYLDIETRKQLKVYLLLAANQRTDDARKALKQRQQLGFFCTVIASETPALAVCR